MLTSFLPSFCSSLSARYPHLLTRLHHPQCSPLSISATFTRSYSLIFTLSHTLSLSHTHFLYTFRGTLSASAHPRTFLSSFSILASPLSLTQSSRRLSTHTHHALVQPWHTSKTRSVLHPPPQVTRAQAPVRAAIAARAATATNLCNFLDSSRFRSHTLATNTTGRLSSQQSSRSLRLRSS